MIYLSRSKRPRRFLALIFVLILVLALAFFGRSFVVRIFAGAARALESGLYAILPAGFRSSRDLALENAELKNQIATLVAQNADRNILATENERLKSSFERNDRDRIVYAAILLRAPGSPYDTLILDVGSRQGIKAGDDVAFGQALIGSIVEAGNDYSKAKLFSSPGNTFSGLLGSDIEIEVRGLGAGAFEAVLPLGASVALGEPLVLPSISSKTFGLVQHIEENADAGFKRILFSLPVNPNQIDAVGVILK